MGKKQANQFTTLRAVPSNAFAGIARRLFSAFLILSSFSLAISTLANSATTQIPLQSQFKNVDTNLRAKIAQKLFLDLRYYCVPKTAGYCQKPLLSLPPELAVMLNKSKVGGVILFSENLSSANQIVNFTHQLQTSVMPKEMPINVGAADKKPDSLDAELRYIPLYIGIDQEGGRVSRLPQHQFLGFAGNMAIGATATTYKNHFATATGQAIAKHLLMLGINVNFAPVLDVNNNPNNPIINVRAYAQFPKVVANLGGASIQAMQQQGVSVAAKHFPGHGDTFIDSHLGLPKVSHKRDVINKVDLLPFRAVIGDKKTRPDMIMTAHIQYPELDNTPFIGDRIDNTEQGISEQEEKPETSVPVLPATLSHKILTGILRGEYAYPGLIVTDALNMSSITQFLTPTQAVIKSFKAGADITLMPYHISSPEDAIGFLDWLNDLTILISQDNELKALIDASYNRIVAHKAKRKIAQRATLPLSEKLESLRDISHRFDDEVLATSLSQASFTQIKGLAKPVLPTQNLLVLMPDIRRCQAFEHYWNTQTTGVGTQKCVSLLSESVPLEVNRLDNIDVIIVADVFPQLAFYESVEFEGIKAAQRIDYSIQQIEIDILLRQAKQMGITSILTKLRSPYISVQDTAKYDAIFATYDYQVSERANLGDITESTTLFSPAFASLVKVITGKQQPEGQLPVTLAPEVIAKLPTLKPLKPSAETKPAIELSPELPKPD